MSFSIQGRLIDVQPIQQIKENFQKREFVIEVVNEGNGFSRTEFIPFQLINGNCDRINEDTLGQTINVHFNLGGNKYEKNNEIRYFPQLTAWKIEILNQQPQQPQSQYQSKPAEQRSYAPEPPQQSQFAPQQSDDDLPF